MTKKLVWKSNNPQTILLNALAYGSILGLCAFVVHWMQYQYSIRLFPTEVYVIVIAISFTILGIWAGSQLTPASKPRPFTKNEAALRTIGITPKEYIVLEKLADGHSNKQIARDLDLSPNTIKTHVANLLNKLDASRRTQAIQKARFLSLIP